VFTLITTYYNNSHYLEKFIERHGTAEDYNIIIVDDCSQECPAFDILKNANVTNMKLFRVLDSLGFNSHGCRNLAMQRTTTEWNMLCDIDYDIVGANVINDTIHELDPSLPCFLPVVTFETKQKDRQSINDFIVTKDTYWKAGGYDTEFTGMHFGDRVFISRMMRGAADQVLIDDCWVIEMESQLASRIEIESNELIERFDKKEGKMFFSTAMKRLVDETAYLVHSRWKHEIMCDPVPFRWEQQI